jgi:hypothetical protein
MRMHGDAVTNSQLKGNAMLRYITIALAAVTLVGASLIPDDASARGGRGGGARVSAGGGARISAGHVNAGRVSAGRVNAGRVTAYRGGRYAGGNYYRRGVGWGVGAAAVGAAAVGAGYYSNSGNGCYYDSYGQWVCPYSNGY